MSVIYKPENFEDFNGVLFLLRESHANKQDKGDEEKVTAGSEKWARNIFLNFVTNTKEYANFFDTHLFESSEKKRYSKRSASCFGGRFCEMLDYIEVDKENLINSAFTNIYLKGGGAKESDDCKEYVENYKYKDFTTLLGDLENNVRIIFTCDDIYKKLKEILKINERSCGVQYLNKDGSLGKQLPYFEWEYENGKTIIVYKIDHPSRSKRIYTKK